MKTAFVLIGVAAMLAKSVARLTSEIEYEAEAFILLDEINCSDGEFEAFQRMTYVESFGHPDFVWYSTGESVAKCSSQYAYLTVEDAEEDLERAIHAFSQKTGCEGQALGRVRLSLPSLNVYRTEHEWRISMSNRNRGQIRYSGPSG